MQLQVGDRFIDETGEWEVVNRLHTTAGGKIAHALPSMQQDAAARLAAMLP